ncbi:tripartite tricarboxylate transporter TctB family protein [Ancylobacter aquaticus]|uniref:Tripartite tricarboxylate transporter TctB family protein n=1 Tax=Ancylobacter aquaticus TaxID=100 RepID=A0A4R1HUH3_ANCAQ|nr:tripartite tricarboxylate transporter TctB family protein [Ancylobacter aquaticus]TCK23589.1 tripartite tricarboxylate transporter TctB family protein [Ancylobacter aquaticus]
MKQDFLSGGVLVALAAAYYAASGSIAESTLSDEIGATGLPRLLAMLLALIGVALIARTAFVALSARRARVPAEAPAEEEEGAPLPRAIGLLLIGGAYVVLLPFIGYFLAVALLIAGVALYEGAARSWVVPAAALGGATLYWAIFVKLLGVHQPAGTLFQGWLL